MNGAELDDLISQLADMLHLLAIHFPDSRRVTGKGWVDWVVIGPRGVLFREAKGDGDTLSGEQRALGYALRADGLNWDVWQARHVGVISAELEAIAALRVPG